MKLRHVALLVEDSEASAVFFENAFGMVRAGTANRCIYMSDGVMNVALIRVDPGRGETIGVFHFGMWVDDLDEAESRVQKAGATYVGGKPTSSDSFYEAKFRDPNGIVFDITHKGWAGAVKDPANPPSHSADQASG